MILGVINYEKNMSFHVQYVPLKCFVLCDCVILHRSARTLKTSIAIQCLCRRSFPAELSVIFSKMCRVATCTKLFACSRDLIMSVVLQAKKENLWCVCAQVLNVVARSCARHSGSFAVWSVDRTTSEPWRPPRLWTQSFNLFSLSVQLKVGPLVNFKRWWSTIFMCVL